MSEVVRIETEGRQLLVAELGKPGRSQSWLGREIKIAQPSVGMWVHGEARPEPHLREIIEIRLGIPASAWTTTAERDAIQQARSNAAKTNEAA